MGKFNFSDYIYGLGSIIEVCCKIVFFRNGYRNRLDIRLILILIGMFMWKVENFMGFYFLKKEL